MAEQEQDLSPVSSEPPSLPNPSISTGPRGIAAGGDITGPVITGDVAGDVAIGYSAAQVREILTQIRTTFQVKPFDGTCPYVGLAAFQESDADRFFGRTRVVTELVGRIQTTRFVILAGQSGSGKSSLVRAGLIPALKEGAVPGSKGWLYGTFKPGRTPLAELGQVVSRWVGNLDAGDDLSTRGGKDAATLHRWAEIALGDLQERRAVLVVDQFEEVFTQVAQEQDRLAFLNLLTHAATVENGRCLILFTLRSDFVPNCAAYPPLNALLNRQFYQVGQLAPDELVSAIAQPALQVGLQIDPDLVTQILADMRGQPGALPLMQFALKDLFDYEKQKGGVVALTRAGYLERQGLRRALPLYADAELAKLSPAEQQLAGSIFSRLIEVGRGTLDTRRTAQFDELIPAGTDAAAVKGVVDKLATARLITTDEQGARETVTLAHEALIDAWGWLKRLVNENREAISLQNEIEQDANEWDRHHREESYLYAGARLATAREQLVANKLVLSGIALQFIQASIHTADRARRRRQQLTIGVIGGLAVAVVIFAVLALVALQEQQRAVRSEGTAVNAQNTAVAESTHSFQQEQTAVAARKTAEADRNVALAGDLTADVLSLLDRDPDLALLLSIQAVGLNDSPLTQDGLRQALFNSSVRAVLHGHNGPVRSVEYSPDGRSLLTAGDDGTARVWDSVSHAPITVLQASAQALSRATWSRDGRLIATAAADGNVRIWNTGDWQAQFSLAGPAAARTLAFSRDAQHLLVLYESGEALLWDLTSRTSQPVPKGKMTSIGVIAYRPDGQEVALGGWNESGWFVNVWDLAQSLRTLDNGCYLPFEGLRSLDYSADGKQVIASNVYTACVWDSINKTVEVVKGSHTWYTTSARFSRDARLIVTAGGDFTVRVWDGRTGDPLSVLRGHAGWVYDAAFGPDGQSLASASADGTVRIWNIVRGEQAVLGLPLQDIDIRTGTFSPDGKQIITGGSNGNVELWDAATGQPLRSFTPGGAFMGKPSYSRDGNWVVFPSDDGTVRVYDVATGKPIHTITSSYKLYAGSLSPDGKLLATAGREQTGNINPVYIWNTSTWERVQTLGVHTGWIGTAQFSPDGQHLVTASVDGTAIIWDMASGKPAHVLRGHHDGVVAARYSPNGRYIVTASIDQTAIIWDAESGQLLRVLAGHPEQLTHADFSPDSQYIVTGSSDSTARIWAAATGKELVTLRGHTNEIFTATFSPDGTRILTTSYDGTARIYLTSTADLVKLAQSRVTRELTCAERVEYLHEQATCATSNPSPTPNPTPRE